MGAVCGAVLAICALVRARRTIADWMFSAAMALLAAECACNVYTERAATVGELIGWQQLRLLVLSLLPGVWILFGLGYARGNARSFLRKWRLVVIAAFVVPVGVAAVFYDGLVGSYQAEPGSRWLLRFGWPGVVSIVLLLLATVVTLMNLERTFRASVGTMRWRIKYMLLGVGLLLIVRIYTCSQGLLFHGIDLSVENVNAGALVVATVLILRSLFRTGEFTPDVYPSASVLQGSFTFLVTGIYLLIVGAFAKLVAYLGGDSAFALKAFVVLVSLVFFAVALQSDRVRMHGGRFVSRYFQRPLYDYRTVWRNFTEGTASRVEQGDLCRALVKLMADTFQSLSVGIWLVDEQEGTMALAASTSLPEAKGREVAPGKDESGAIIRHFQGHPEPADIELRNTSWAETLRRMHPSDFPNGGHRVCLPLIERGRVLGLLIIGDRVGGVPFSTQDFDMLRCVGDHAAVSLLTAQFSRSLLQAKEFEAFQTMAAFFVHDLKNAASTLNLMLQNLPVHFDDPAFREDALRGVGKTVDHINHLVSRLGLLRHELGIQPAEADLNDVVSKALETLGVGTDDQLIKEFSPSDRIQVDREQMSKVITNLVLNAVEASAGKGRVRVATRQDPGWAVITVEDSGCGMSEEFVRRSLFRPFQTTKKNGLGIGMFQSKMIVEAHRGRIAVESAPGRGTTFQVFLPVEAKT